jgi:hypothetical protein
MSGSTRRELDAADTADEDNNNDNDNDNDDDKPAKRARLAQHASPLAQAYWRQRLDRMTGGRGRSASRSATPHVKNEPDDPATPLSVTVPAPSPSSYTPVTRRGHQDLPPAPLTNDERADIQSSASYWYVLVDWARRENDAIRGRRPGWVGHGAGMAGGSAATAIAGRLLASLSSRTPRAPRVQVPTATSESR